MTKPHHPGNLRRLLSTSNACPLDSGRHVPPRTINMARTYVPVLKLFGVLGVSWVHFLIVKLMLVLLVRTVGSLLVLRIVSLSLKVLTDIS